MFGGCISLDESLIDIINDIGATPTSMGIHGPYEGGQKGRHQQALEAYWQDLNNHHWISQ